jgi:hypothetical protein
MLTVLIHQLGFGLDLEFELERKKIWNHFIQRVLNFIE